MKQKNKHSKISKKRQLNTKKLLKVFVFIIIVIVAIFALTKIIHRTSANEILTDENSNSNANLNSEEPQNKTAKLTVLGDIMCHSTNYADAYNASNKSYDFSYVFNDISPYLSNSDLTIGNLETTFAGAQKGYNGYPCFNTPENLGITLKNLGVDVLTTANNHSLDTGYAGIESTLNFLDEYGLSHTGTARSQEEQNNILIKNVNGIKIAFLTYTYGTNGNIIPKGKEYCVNLIDKELILKQIQEAKDQNVDLICTSMHWGVEYQTKQNKEQEDLANFLFENGVDIILGSHPHVLEPMEKKSITLADGTTKDVFVIYSLGNFMSGQTFPNTQDSVILNLELNKDENNKTTINSVTYTPIYMFYSRNSKPKYKIINIRKSIQDYDNKQENVVSTTTYNTLQKELKQIETIVGPEITNNEPTTETK